MPPYPPMRPAFRGLKRTLLCGWLSSALMQSVHTILSGEAIAQALGQWRKELGAIQQCELLRRGFNEV